MNDNWYERVRKKLKKFASKNKVCRGLAFTALFFARLFWGIGMFLSGNVIRIMTGVCCIVFFVLSTSFTEIDSAIEIEEVKTEEPVAVKNELPVAIYKPVETTTEDPLTDVLKNEDIEEIIIDDIEVYSADEVIPDSLESDLAPSETYSGDSILAENENRIIKIDEDYEIDKNDWRLLLINKQHPVPDDYEFTLGNLYGGLQCDERIVDNVLAMIKAAKEDKINLVINSPYRDYNLQVILFNRKLDKYMGMGYSYLEACEIGSRTVTLPGASEHQIGLAFDITCDYFQNLVAAFGDTEAGKWLREHCKEYGFIIRYPKDKEYITGINYEPWHFRYVGVEAATIIMENDLTLEEFLDELE